MEIRLKYERLSRLLSASVKTKVKQLVPQYLAHAGGLKNAHALQASATTLLRSKFPMASPAQTDLLAFYLLSIAAIVNGSRNGASSSLSEITDLESMGAQMVLERRSMLTDVLSNIMKKMSNTQESIVQNLKG